MHGNGGEVICNVAYIIAVIGCGIACAVKYVPAVRREVRIFYGGYFKRGNYGGILVRKLLLGNAVGLFLLRIISAGG